jgi:hypothetical protein
MALVPVVVLAMLEWDLEDRPLRAQDHAGEERRGVANMARMNKQDQWQQEQAKLKAYGFKWRFAGIIEGKKGLPQKQ